jgi:hypothetical protein
VLASNPPERNTLFMTGTKYIGMDVHKESISIAVRNAAGKLVMECVIETKSERHSGLYPRAARRVARHVLGNGLVTMPDKRCQLNRSMQHFLINWSDNTSAGE